MNIVELGFEGGAWQRPITKRHKKQIEERIKEYCNRYTQYGFLNVILNNNQVRKGIGKILEKQGFKKVSEGHNGNSGCKIYLYVRNNPINRPRRGRPWHL